MSVAVTEESLVQGGRLGRLVIARLKPNEDIIDSAEALCKDHGIHLAVVRGGLGSLIDGQLSYLGRQGMIQVHVEGPGVEILSVSGEILSGESRLQAVVADADGKLYAGRLERGKNLTFITVELTLQEWLPD
ncbi:PPC domain-containing DNA-binding protein [Pseudomonas silesiensis]|jgi:predicted DNA-binding protein with PD1-like motif|uniref:PPC domain-containing DNA-binding protein n=1 Tax=Pseudomonas silesiensis TaxID=1853130 RepID=UPI0034D73D7A